LWCIAVAIVGDRHLAEDVLQEAAVIALRKLDDFDASTSFTAWMGQIVRYVALNSARRRGGSPVVHIDPAAFEQVLGVSASTGANPGAFLSGTGEMPAAHEAFDDRVLAALRALDETARACLLMRVLADLPYREIALALSIPQGTAMSHVHRARAALSQKLSPETCAAPEPGGPEP
jgi:RNA polymerase sigma-70 factor (ECF subfamily)